MVQRRVAALVAPVVGEKVDGRLQLVDRRKVAIEVAPRPLEKLRLDLPGDVELGEHGLGRVERLVDVLVRLGQGVGANLGQETRLEYG